jgi:hypothetical protein
MTIQNLTLRQTMASFAYLRRRSVRTHANLNFTSL